MPHTRARVILLISLQRNNCGGIGWRKDSTAGFAIKASLLGYFPADGVGALLHRMWRPPNRCFLDPSYFALFYEFQHWKTPTLGNLISVLSPNKRTSSLLSMNAPCTLSVHAIFRCNGTFLLASARGTLNSQSTVASSGEWRRLARSPFCKSYSDYPRNSKCGKSS